MGMKALLFILSISIVFFCQVAADSKLFPYTCNIRYEMADILREEKDCSLMRFLHPMCGRDITASFSDAHPYVFAENIAGRTIVRGLLPGKQNLSPLLHEKAETFFSFAIFRAIVKFCSTNRLFTNIFLLKIPSIILEGFTFV